MKKITLLTTKDLDGFIQDDQLLVGELEQQGFQVKEKPWETLQDEGEDLFIVRTTWNYTDHYDEFIQALKPIQDRLWNPLPLIKWNSNKRYLIELLEKGLKVLPLTLAKDEDSLHQAMDQLGGDEFIVKPIIGASAIGLKRFNRSNLPTLDKEMIVQRFYPEITQGEVSLIYFNGEFSYALRKTPTAGDIRVQEEYGGKIVPYSPNSEEREWADEVIKHIPTQWLYARVDLLPGHGLMELECIEPSLYFRSHSEGAHFMAQAITKICKK